MYVTPAVKECRMSKSELPRSIFGLAIEFGVFRKAANSSVEAMSTEWETNRIRETTTGAGRNLILPGVSKGD